MANRVNKSLNAGQIESVRDHLSDALGTLRQSSVVLTVNERKEIPKARKNFEKFLKVELQMASDRGVNVPAYPQDSIKEDLQMQEDMSLLLDQISTLHTMVLDTYRTARSEAWEAFLNYYHVLNALSIGDPELKSRMKPIIDFMGRTSRKNDDESDEPSELKEVE